MATLFRAMILSLIATAPAFAQSDRHDPALVLDEIDGYKAQLLLQVDGTKLQERKVLRPDITGLDHPKSPDEFQQAWHNPPVSQGLTGQCWSFAATSLIESEAQRIHGTKLQLSQSWTVYWESVEKARRFIREHGKSVFDRGSEPNAIRRIWAQYGLVPLDAYKGLLSGPGPADDRRMYAMMEALLDSCRKKNDWDERRTIANIRKILDRHMGPPPETVQIDGVKLTPREYLNRVVKLDVADYVAVMSTMSQPWHEWHKFDVPDNWWRSTGYYNLPLDEFTRVIRETVRAGGTICLSADTGESGFYYHQGIAFVPTFDVPSRFIDDAARQLRFASESTTDDHVVHIVGSQQRNGRWWYLIRDSGTQSHNAPQPGYMFYDEDYLRLKGLALLLPRQAVEKVVGKPIGDVPKDAD